MLRPRSRQAWETCLERSRSIEPIWARNGRFYCVGSKRPFLFFCGSEIIIQKTGGFISEKSLQPVEQKEVEMYGDMVTAVRAEDGEIYVVVAHMCDALGLTTQPQTRRIQRHAVLSDGMSRVAIMATQGSAQPQRRRMQALRAVVKLARQQIALEAKVSDHGHRLEELEAAIASPEAVVTQDQAMQISQAVKLVAISQGEKSGRNEFGATYGELYRKFGITSYKNASSAKFQAIMAWLNEWFVTLSDDDWPF